MTDRIIITPDQYTATLAPVRPPSALELFEYERQALTDKRLTPVGMFDHLVERLPESGLFILVPPQPGSVDTLDWNELMARVELGRKTGRNYLVLRYLKDEIEVPETATMLVCVEDGRARANVRPMDSRTAIITEGRHPYTVWRGYIHVLLFPNVLTHHFLDCVGSRWAAGGVPGFHRRNEAPALDSGWEDGAFPEWGAPSCGSVEA